MKSSGRSLSSVIRASFVKVPNLLAFSKWRSRGPRGRFPPSGNCGFKTMAMPGSWSVGTSALSGIRGRAAAIFCRQPHPTRSTRRCASSTPSCKRLAEAFCCTARAPSGMEGLSCFRACRERGRPRYRACGTPFAGELARPGENAAAPVERLYFLAKGPENGIAPIEAGEALRLLLRNILFFADDPELVKMVFRSANDFLGKVPAYRLTFYPDGRVWDLIQ